jgi:hypothetical protein
MSTVPVTALRTDLIGRLDGLERRVRLLALVKGAGAAAVVITTSLAAGLLVDALWDLSPSVRVALLGTVGLIAAVAVWSQLVRPILLSASSAEVAALVEAAHPELQERLTSAIELGDPSIPERDKGSALMRELLLKQTRRAVAQVDVTDAAAAGAAGRWGAAGTAAVAALFVPFLFMGGAYGLLLSRFFAPWENLERATNLYFEVENGDRTVARGSDVEIAATPRWRRGTEARPDEAWLNWRGEHAETDARRMVWNDARGAFVATLPHVFQPFDFNVSAGSARTRDYHVNVAEAPAIVALSLTVDPPAYTGRAREVVDGAVGEVTILEGSRVSLQLQFNKPLSDAALVWSPDPAPVAEGQAAPVPPPHQILAVAFAPDRLSGILELVADRSKSFAIQLTDEFGLHNENEPVRRLRVVADAAPAIQFVDHNDRPQARPIDIVRVPVAAIDDIGVASLELHYEVVNGGEGTGILEADVTAVGGRTADYVFLFDLKPLSLTEGALVSIRARAADERPVPGPNEGWTDTRLITLTDQAEPYGAQQVAERQQQLREILESLRQAVVENRDAVEALRADAADDLSRQAAFDQDAAIPPLAQTDRDLAERLDQLAALFELHPLFANLAERTRQVGREPLTNAAERLDHAGPAPLAEKVNDLQQAKDQLTAAADTLKSLGEEFEKLAELERDLLELQQLADQTQRLATDVAAFDTQRSQAQRPNQTPAQQQARQEFLAAEQQRLLQDHEMISRDLEGLLDRRPELIDAALQHELDRLTELAKQAAAVADREEMLANALRHEAQQEAAQSQPAAERQQQVLEQAEWLAARPELAAAQPADPLNVEQLRQALEDLKAGNTEAAAARQESAARALERLAGELAKNAQLPADPQQAARELAQRQRALQEEIQRAAAPPAERDPQQTQRTPDARELAAAQGALQAAAAQLPTPPAARPQRDQATAAAGESLEQLRNEAPQNAAEPAGRAADALEQLANQMGTPQERRDQALAEVERMQQTQRELSQQVAEALQQQPNVPPEQTAERLAELAPRQQQLGEQVAGLDAPGAEPQQASAAQQSAQAQQQLTQPPSPAAAESQRRAEQSLSDLERALRGEPGAAEAVDAMQQRQTQVADAARKAGENQDQPGMAAQAAAQQQIADDLGQVEAPAAPQQQAAAQEAAGQAAEALRQAASDPARTAESMAAVERAATTLGELAQQLAPQQAEQNSATAQTQPAATGEPQQGPDPQTAGTNDSAAGSPPAGETAPSPAAELAQAAAELARQQRALANEAAAQPSGNAQAQSPPGDPMTASQPASNAQDPQSSAASPSQTPSQGAQHNPAQMAQRQGELARDAAELALETARRTGPESQATEQARQFAQQASQAAEQASAGQLSDAAQSAAQAAQSAQGSAQQLQDPQPSAGEPQPELGRQAEQLAERQQQAAEELQSASQSPAARRAAQQQGQQQLAQAAQELQRQIADVADRLASEPIQAEDQAQQASQSREATQQARSAMQAASSELSQQNLGRAALSAQ